MTFSSDVGTIINFCSNDYPFLRHSIDSVKSFSSQILIPVCDHFFDGKKEDRETLHRIYAENPDVQFIEFPFDKDKSLYGSHSSNYWHNISRMMGFFFLREDTKHVLFLDCDEVAESGRICEWLNTFNYRDYDAIRFLNYWYFRESHLQAKTWEHSPLMVKKERLNGSILMNGLERIGMFEQLQGPKLSRVPGVDGMPMFHHYSWVRTREQLLRKVVSWGHNRDRDWVARVEEEFSRPFNGTDFVHGYEFFEVEPFVKIDILKQPSGISNGDFPNVRKLTHEEVLRIDVSLTYDIPLCL